MTPPLPVLAPFRPIILLAALVGAALPTAHATGRNHDLQAILIPAVPWAIHDRAPGPGLR